MRQDRQLLAALVLLCAASLAGCGDDTDKPCEYVDFMPTLSPVNMGQLKPLGSQEANPIDSTRVPYEWTVFLDAPCGDTINIEKVCLLGESASQFALEGPEGSQATRSQPSAIRVTYDREAPAAIDNVALVIESNSKDHPTMLIPICAQVIDDGATAEDIECTSPVTLEEASCP